MLATFVNEFYAIGMPDFIAIKQSHLSHKYANAMCHRNMYDVPCAQWIESCALATVLIFLLEKLKVKISDIMNNI